ncbi:MAG: hypothetical protein CSA79_05515 [Thiothrix nivea]|nr:MAG: hypothetical protein CSA79_05515 [Thiothrix nivea]
MEATKLQTVDDLLLAGEHDERIELINGEIIRRPMHCPTHDLAGWRKERVPQRPHGMMTMTPDWVGEITSPGHERKDTITQLLRLQAYQVPYYWVISPEDKMLIAYALEAGNYRVAYPVECGGDTDCGALKIVPFLEMSLDLGYVFGE